jgi:hypothetical protein
MKPLILRNNYDTSNHDSFDDLIKKRRDLVRKHNFKYTSEYGFYDPLMSGSIDGMDEKPHDRAIENALTSKYHLNSEALKT